jgi:hypothetical protein
MTGADNRLIHDLARRNRWILLAMLALSLLWRSWPVVVGVLGGGLVVIAGFHALHHSLARLLLTAGKSSGVAFQCGTLVRLLGLAGAIFLLIGPLQAHPLALIAGLSVVVINLLMTTAMRCLR